MEHVKPDVQYHFHNTFTENLINNDGKHDTTPVGTTKTERESTTNYTSSLKRRENIQNETFKSFLLISMLTILFAKLFKEKYEAFV